jgi:hypothetical protein
MNLIIFVSHCGSYAAVYEASFITTTAMHLDIPTHYLRNTLGANVLSSTIGKKKNKYLIYSTHFGISMIKHSASSTSAQYIGGTFM